MTLEEKIMANSVVSRVLREARIRAGFSQRDVYERLNIRQSTFSSWETGKAEPDIATFLKLCDVYGIDNPSALFLGVPFEKYTFSVREAELLKRFRRLDERGKLSVENCAEFGMGYARGFEYSDVRPKRLRPVSVSLQPAAAGRGNFVDSADWEVIEADAPAYADFGIRISGDSMEPLIHSGDVVWVKRQEVIESGEIGIFMLNDNAYCKKFVRRGGETLLISLNPKYEPIKINESDSISVYGKVLI